MKKLLCFIFILLVSGCTLTAKEPEGIHITKDIYHIEDNAKLNITVDDKKYAMALNDIWNKLYPQHCNALQIQVKPYKFSQHIEGDIDWVKDSDAAYRLEEAYAISSVKSHIDYSWNDKFQRKDTEDFFLPIEGKGLIYVVNDYNLKQHHAARRDIESMEHMQKLDAYAYYHNRLGDYVYPLLFQEYSPILESRISMDTLFHDDKFQENVEAYRKLNNDLGLEDGIFDKTTFYKDGSYISGLVMNDAAYEKSSEYKNGHLHFSAMPSYRDEPLSPVLDIYGFMVHKDVKYPNAAMAFLQMVRSHKGLLAMLETTKKYPLIKAQDIDDLKIFDIHKKEILSAMNESQLRSTVDIKERPSITFEKLYKDSDFLSILQNSTYTKDSSVTVQKNLLEEMKKWILKQ